MSLILVWWFSYCHLRPRSPVVFTHCSIVIVQFVFFQLIQLQSSKVLVEGIIDFPVGRMNSRDYLGDRWKRKNYPEGRMVWGLMKGYQEDHFLVDQVVPAGQRVLYLKQKWFSILIAFLCKLQASQYFCLQTVLDCNGRAERNFPEPRSELMLPPLSWLGKQY